MKIKLVSDLHLEFSDVDIKNNGCDVLILSGDIMIAKDLHDHPAPAHGTIYNIFKLGRRQEAAARFRDFLKRCSDSFNNVIYIAGNHEFYHGAWNSSLQYLREECAKFPNLHFLERDTVKINDVTFVGATLWTDLNQGDPLTLYSIRNIMNDYSVVVDDSLGYTKLKPITTAIRHKETVSYFKDVIAGLPNEKIVVVGHHCPTKKSIHTKYADKTIMNSAYASDLSDFILNHPQIKLWTCGHTHHAHWYYVGDTLVACNPRGYEGWEEYTGWNPEFVLDLDAMPTVDYVNNNFGNLK